MTEATRVAVDEYFEARWAEYEKAQPANRDRDNRRSKIDHMARFVMLDTGTDVASWRDTCMTMGDPEKLARFVEWKHTAAPARWTKPSSINSGLRELERFFAFHECHRIADTIARFRKRRR